MFRCEECKATQPSYTKPHRVIVEKRAQTYNNEGRITHGWEVVREANLCDDCYKEQPVK